MLEEIFSLSRHFLKIKNTDYKRYLIRETDFKQRLSIIIGQRGVGKTTTLIQTLLEKVDGDILDPRILYIQADHFLLSNASLYDIAEQFFNYGGKWIAFDEIHKYSSWSLELKSIYDTFPGLHVLASGSSALEIYRGSHDLTRRALTYKMQGLSFREFLELTLKIELPSVTLSQICENHEKISLSILDKIENLNTNKKILPEFHRYLKIGYFPYFFDIDNEAAYKMILEQNLHTSIESDLVAIHPHLTGVTVAKLRQLAIYIANSVPFIPNWNKIKEILEVGDVRTLKNYFSLLENASVFRSITKATEKNFQLESVAKIYLDNPNQLFAIASGEPEKGSVRETFFLNMLSKNHSVKAPKSGDFIINGSYIFEVGGKKKSFHQIKEKKESYLACDDLEQGFGNKIPLWLFGFIY